MPQVPLSCGLAWRDFCSQATCLTEEIDDQSARRACITTASQTRYDGLRYGPIKFGITGQEYRLKLERGRDGESVCVRDGMTRQC